MKNLKVALLAGILFLPIFFADSRALIAESWIGVDENIVEKIASEHGRAAREPFINTDQGDLLLFLFLLAGTAGGFVLGYSFRKLFYEKCEAEDVKRDI